MSLNMNRNDTQLRLIVLGCTALSLVLLVTMFFVPLAKDEFGPLTLTHDGTGSDATAWASSEWSRLEITDTVPFVFAIVFTVFAAIFSFVAAMIGIHRARFPKRSIATTVFASLTALFVIGMMVWYGIGLSIYSEDLWDASWSAGILLPLGALFASLAAAVLGPVRGA